MSGSGSVTIPGVTQSISLSFTGSGNLMLAKQIADALAAAQQNSKLDVVNYTGGTVPTVPGGDTILELVLSPTISGSITVPAAPSGVTEVLVVQNTQNVTIHGSPGMEIIGAGAGHVDVIDPTIIDYSFNASTSNQDAVTVTSADTSFEVAMRAGKESVDVQGSGTGTIWGGSGSKTTDQINLLGATGNISVVTAASDGGVGDTVYAGAGNTTIHNLTTAADALDFGGSGLLYVQDSGTGDTIVGSSGNAAVTTAGSDALVFGGAGAPLTVYNTGGHDTILAGAASVVSLTSTGIGGGEDGLLFFGGVGGVTATDDGSHDTIVGGSTSTKVTLESGAIDPVFVTGGGLTSVDAAANSALIYGGTTGLNVTMSGSGGTVIGASGGETIHGASATGLLVFGPTTGGVDYIGGSNSAELVLGGGSNTVSGTALVFGGTKGLDLTLAAGATNDTIVGDTGPVTVHAGSASNLLVFGPSGGVGLDFVGGSGSATVVGQDSVGGGDSVTGGTGPLVIVAGPHDILAATGSGAGTTLFGSAGSDVTYSGESGKLTYLAAGGGNATLNASASGTNNIFWASGADTKSGDAITGGAGNDTLVAGTGSDSLSGGAGDNQFLFLSAILGSGSGQTDTINGFLDKNADNIVGLFGMHTTGSATHGSGAGAYTTVTLSDNTTITFLGVSDASQLSGHIYTS